VVVSHSAVNSERDRPVLSVKPVCDLSYLFIVLCVCAVVVIRGRLKWKWRCSIAGVGQTLCQALCKLSQSCQVCAATATYYATCSLSHLLDILKFIMYHNNYHSCQLVASPCCHRICVTYFDDCIVPLQRFCMIVSL